MGRIGGADAARGDGEHGEDHGPLIVVWGLVRTPPRSIRTATGWEIADLLLDRSGVSGASDDADDGDHRGRAYLRVICCGCAAAVVPERVAPGDEVLVIGRLRVRGSSGAGGRAVELEADALLKRRRPAAPTHRSPSA